MPRRRSESEFCSEVCAHTYLDHLKTKRLGGGAGAGAKPVAKLPIKSQVEAKPAAVGLRAASKAVSKDSPALSKIRSRVEAASESRRLAALATSIFHEEEPSILKAVKPVEMPLPQPQFIPMESSPDPVKLTEQFPVGEPREALVDLSPTGVFDRFPIGDLALVAPAELPNLPESSVPARPRQADNVYRLNQPEAAESPSARYTGRIPNLPAGDGRPLELTWKPAASRNKFLKKLDPATELPPLRIEPAGLLAARTMPLDRPVLETPSQDRRPRVPDEISLLTVTRLTTPSRPGKIRFDAELQLGLLNMRVLEVRVGVGTSEPVSQPKPVEMIGWGQAKPNVPDLGIEVALFDLAGSSMLPIPGYKPQLKDLPIFKRDSTPWIVPGRPRIPQLCLQPMEAPQPWRMANRRLLTSPAPLAYESPSSRPKIEIPQEQIEVPEGFDDMAEELVQGAFRNIPSDFGKQLNSDQIKEKLAVPALGPPKGRIPFLGMLLERWEGTAKQVKIVMVALPFLIWLAVRPAAHLAVGAPSPDEHPAVPILTAHTETARDGVTAVVSPAVSKDLEAKFEKETNRQMEGLRKFVSSRAAVEIADDFHAGLDNWQGRNNGAPGWSYDRTGFVRPRSLAIFEPSVGMADYAFEFLAKIDQRSVGWVFRATDVNNYYAMKLVDKTGGVIPQMALVHYVVIDGWKVRKKKCPFHSPSIKTLCSASEWIYRVLTSRFRCRAT